MSAQDTNRFKTSSPSPQSQPAETMSVQSSPIFAPAAGNFSPGDTVVLLGRSYSAAQMLEAQALLGYVKKQDSLYRFALRVSNLRQVREAVQNTRLIDALNRGRKWALKRLSERLAPLLSEDLIIVVVPSHDPWQQQTPIRDLAQQIAALTSLTDGTSCLVRHTKITRIVFGGPSTSELHRDTIQVQDADLVRGRRVLLLDDIVKSGQSLATCCVLLQEAGATIVQAAALGKVIGGDVFPDVLAFRSLPSDTSFDHRAFFQVNSMPSRVVVDNKDTPTTNPVAGLEPIPGDTYPLRAELKALGAVWDATTRTWHITPEKLPLAQALVEHQALVPPKGLPTDENGEVIDPFEEEAQQPQVVTLGPQDGASYEHRDTLRAVGARWDKSGRTWTIREERAEYARAVLKAVAEAPASSTQSAGIPEKRPHPRLEPPTEGVATTPLPSVAQEMPPRSHDQRGIESNLSTLATDFPEAPGVGGEKTSAKLIKLGGLWISRSKNGRTFLSAKLTPNVRLLIFKNQFKTTDAQPDYEMYLAPVVQDENSNGKSSASQDIF